MTPGKDNDLNDSLDDMLGGPVVGPRPAPPANYQTPDYTEGCKACGGTGKFHSYTGRLVGECFKCKGKGSKTFKSAPEDREVARRRASAKRVEKGQAIETEARAWIEAHKAEAEWLAQAGKRNIERGGTFTFPQDLLDKLWKYGSLSENQLAAVHKLMARDAERNAQFAKAREERTANAPSVNVSRIEEAFAKATANKVRFPKLRLDTFVFSPAGANSKNPGAVYVKEGDEYLGKVMGGKFLCVSTCGDERKDRIAAAANDPEAAAIAYGKRFSECSVCGLTLTNGKSIDRGIGPICASKYGW